VTNTSLCLVLVLTVLFDPVLLDLSADNPDFVPHETAFSFFLPTSTISPQSACFTVQRLDRFCIETAAILRYSAVISAWHCLLRKRRSMCGAGHDWLRRVSNRGNNIVRRHSKYSELAVTRRASCPEFDALLLQCCYSCDTISP
jgi:hypothetical protein